MRNQSGQSLIQALITIAIMGIVATGMSSMLSNLNRETRALSEKLAAMDLEKLLIGSMADGSACIYALNNPTPKTFNAATAMSAENPLVIPLSGSGSDPARLYSSYQGGTPPKLGPVVVEVGKLAAPYSSSLRVSGISLELTDISGANVNGRWRIDFDSTKLARPIRPLYVSVALGLDVTNAAAAKFTSCQVTATGAGSGGDGDWCGAFVSGPFNGYPGHTAYIDKVLMKCKGKTPTCASGASPAPSNTIAPCRSMYLYVGYSLDSACPSGYKLTQIMQAMSSYTPGVHDPYGGPNNRMEQSPTQILYTCTPN